MCGMLAWLIHVSCCNQHGVTLLPLTFMQKFMVHGVSDHGWHAAWQHGRHQSDDALWLMQHVRMCVVHPVGSKENLMVCFGLI